jgi:hypothetical protein
MKDFDQEGATPGAGSADGDATGGTAVDPPDDQRFFNESLEFCLRSLGRALQKRRKQT